jgi:hypothetical protein
MNQKSTEINKNDIPDAVKAKAEYEAVLYGDSYVFIGTLEDILKKYGLEAYHKYLVDGRIPKEGDK